MGTWMVTGTSTGFGRAIAEAARDAGHDVIATARNLDDIAELPGVRPVRLDLADLASRTAAGAHARQADVLVNNAGFGLLGALEGLEDASLREAFEVNLFGHLDLVRAALAGMRERRYGRIVQMSSVVAVTSGLGGGGYAGPKAALEAISVALAAESHHLGVRVTIVQPGPFRTPFGGASLRWGAPLPDYEPVVAPAREAMQQSHGRQPNDPARGAAAILAAVELDEPPLHLPLGPEAFSWIRAHLSNRLEELDTVEPLGTATAFGPE
jgi:NAD(P)-dependent dehydrogenase (short-subunit alcohol dehydrogenase family)